jgi:hypothetical protein
METMKMPETRQTLGLGNEKKKKEIKIFFVFFQSRFLKKGMRVTVVLLVQLLAASARALTTVWKCTDTNTSRWEKKERQRSGWHTVRALTDTGFTHSFITPSVQWTQTNCSTTTPSWSSGPLHFNILRVDLGAGDVVATPAHANLSTQYQVGGRGGGERVCVCVCVCVCLCLCLCLCDS